MQKHHLSKTSHQLHPVAPQVPLSSVLNHCFRQVTKWLFSNLPRTVGFLNLSHDHICSYSFLKSLIPQTAVLLDNTFPCYKHRFFSQSIYSPRNARNFPFWDFLITKFRVLGLSLASNQIISASKEATSPHFLLLLGGGQDLVVRIPVGVAVRLTAINEARLAINAKFT